MIRPTGAWLLLLFFAASGFFGGGCTSSRQALLARQGAELDSMYASNHDMAEHLSQLRDSLQFYDDIDSGQYYREKRRMEQEIERLKYELSVCSDGGSTLETLLADDLFEPASAQLTDAGTARLAVLADTLKAAVSTHSVRVEGHSDSTPIGSALKATYPSNWELSAARASAVVRFLTESAVPPEKIQVVSYGSTRPVAGNQSADGRRRNRRIRVALVPQ